MEIIPGDSGNPVHRICGCKRKNYGKNGSGTAVISAKTKYYAGTLKIQVGETGGSGSDNGNTGETGGPGNDNGNGNSWWDLYLGMG